MVIKAPSSATSANQLLARLSQGEHQRLSSRLQTVPLPLKQILYRAHAPIDDVYFPTRGVISAMTVMEDGTAIEVATVGNEGMMGLTAFIEDETSPNEVMVQVEGEALRMSAAALQEEAGPDSSLRRLLVRYHTAYSTQVSYAVACNGLHTIQKRCCRWLLMTHDRVGTDVLPLTHEFLAIMLGVRRSSVSEVLHPLQEQGFIRCNRGQITLLDREGLEATSCECYRAVRDEFERLFSGR